MRMTVVASVYGHRDGSGIHRVIERLEQHPLRDPILVETGLGSNWFDAK